MGSSIGKEGLTNIGPDIKSGKLVLVSNHCIFMGVKCAGLETGLGNAGQACGEEIGEQLLSPELGESLGRVTRYIAILLYS